SVYSDVLASDVPDDPFLQRELELYFPVQLRDAYTEQMKTHALRREIIATRLTNSTVNRAGITFVFRMADETGMSAPDIVRAHAAALEIFGATPIWDDIERLDGVVDVAVQRSMFMDVRTLAERASRWLLRNRRQPLQINETVSYFAADLARLAERLPELLTGGVSAAFSESVKGLVGVGVPEDLARRVAGLPAMLSGLDIIDIAQTTGKELEEAASVYFALGDVLVLDWIRDQIAKLPRDDRWGALARAALRDDLYSVRAAITAEVLRAGAAGRPGTEQVRAWFDKMGTACTRCLGALDEIVAGGRSDLATLSVALREVRGLAQSG
ncbi:MAG TPA: hypothetical protein VGS21_02135, partial [Acidimicrobiales bacterium]|nr:hypothetical protein [Acidimicrobiales bacterium]